jgi:predicted RNA binding protein YcfA (HicA-like mRNA interferase family)
LPKITPVDYRILLQVFEREGFTVSRRRGDHIVMTKPGVPRPLVIKCSPHQDPVTHIRTNLTTAGMSRERYFELLEIVRWQRSKTP